MKSSDKVRVGALRLIMAALKARVPDMRHAAEALDCHENLGERYFRVGCERLFVCDRL